jgi:hypothetical protein
MNTRMIRPSEKLGHLRYLEGSASPPASRSVCGRGRTRSPSLRSHPSAVVQGFLDRCSPGHWIETTESSAPEVDGQACASTQ